jgi:hypothetical protein
MIKSHHIAKGTATALLSVLGLMTIVWGHAKPALPAARGTADSVRAIRLRLTFESGHWADVTEVEGGTINIEKDGKKLAITPYIRDQGKVELRVFQAVRHEGGETMEAAGTLSVEKRLTKLDRVGLPLSVQVLDAEKRLPSELLTAPAATCCARACDGTLVCGVCVCTDCGQCATRNWCDCPPPAPPEE